MRKSQELTDPRSCMSRALDNEMTFVLLGRDVAAPVAIRAWIEERIRLGKNTRDDSQILEALACADTMEGEYVRTPEDRARILQMVKAKLAASAGGAAV